MSIHLHQRPGEPADVGTEGVGPKGLAAVLTNPSVDGVRKSSTVANCSESGRVRFVGRDLSY
jgi:hypothetical protein